MDVRDSVIADMSVTLFVVNSGSSLLICFRFRDNIQIWYVIVGSNNNKLCILAFDSLCKGHSGTPASHDQSRGQVCSSWTRDLFKECSTSCSLFLSLSSSTLCCNPCTVWVQRRSLHSVLCMYYLWPFLKRRRSCQAWRLWGTTEAATREWSRPYGRTTKECCSGAKNVGPCLYLYIRPFLWDAF